MELEKPSKLPGQKSSLFTKAKQALTCCTETQNKNHASQPGGRMGGRGDTTQHNTGRYKVPLKWKQGGLTKKHTPHSSSQLTAQESSLQSARIAQWLRKLGLETEVLMDPKHQTPRSALNDVNFSH